MLFDLTPDRTYRCAGGPLAGAVAVLEVLLRRHPRSRSLGIYVCRAVRGRRGGFSRHAGGGAFDWDPGNDSDPDGWAVAHALVAQARLLGVQRIIWDGQIWEHARGWHRYRGSAGPHRDHLHIELTDEAAASLSMTYVMSVFGVARAPRKDRPVPTAKPTDIVDILGLPKVPGRSAGGVIGLQRDGAIVTLQGKPKLHGSMHSPELKEARRRSTGVFVHLAHGKNPGEYVVFDSHIDRFGRPDHPYEFTASTLKQLRK